MSAVQTCMSRIVATAACVAETLARKMLHWFGLVSIDSKNVRLPTAPSSSSSFDLAVNPNTFADLVIGITAHHQSSIIMSKLYANIPSFLYKLVF